MTDIKKLRHRCFFDITVGTKYIGRIVFELFNDVCPITCDNFRSLCTGEKGLGQTTGKPLHYKNVVFHRIVKQFIIQSGDFSMGNGRGGESIFGGTFNDENFDLKHDKPFLLSMANRGKDTNGSQFFITLNPAPHLDGVHVVFGHVLSGQEVIDEVQNQPIGEDCKPLTEVIISNCGELIPQIKPKDKKKKHRKEKSKRSDGELTSDEEDREGEQKSKKKKEKKHKKHKKSKEELKQNDDKETDELNAECSVRPEEIPDIPQNNFLMREIEPKDNNERREDIRFNRDSFKEHKSYERTSSGRKFKGRGLKRYRTPSPTHDSYRSGSETPPHWRKAQSNLISLKEVISAKQRKSENRDFERNRFERRGSYRQRPEFDRYMSREYDFGHRFQRESQRETSDNENRFGRQTSRKRVFTEEPPLRKRNESRSPKQDSIERNDRKNGNNVDSYSDRHFERKENERNFIKSEVKLNEDFAPNDRKRNRKEMSDERHLEVRYDKQSVENAFDLTDIPLPKTETKKRSDDRHDRSRTERTVDSELGSKRETKQKSSNSRDKRSSSQRKISSRRRRHSSDSE